MSFTGWELFPSKQGFSKVGCSAQQQHHLGLVSNAWAWGSAFIGVKGGGQGFTRSLFFGGVLKDFIYLALADIAQWIEHGPANQRVAGLTPSLGHMLGLQARSPVGDA